MNQKIAPKSDYHSSVMQVSTYKTLLKFRKYGLKGIFNLCNYRPTLKKIKSKKAKVSQNFENLHPILKIPSNFL